MSLLLKVRQNVPQVKSLKTSLKKHAGQKLPHMLTNASDLFLEVLKLPCQEKHLLM